MGIKIITDNRKAFHEYIVSDRFEAGLVLTGTEVKAARAGKVNLSDGWIDFDEQGEAWLREAHIGKYSHGNIMNHDERRPRKLLLKHKEIVKLTQRTAEQGFTVLPLKMYFKDSFIKLEIGVGKGKKQHDKRDAAKTREANRDIARAMRARNK
jgi:SsrA-binding protein